MTSKPPKDAPGDNVVPLGRVTCIVRPEPPRDLPAEAAAEWRQIVDSLPADWFSGAQTPLLAQYCRHVAAARRVAQLIKKELADAGGPYLSTLDKLLRMQERESRAISSLATRMRLTQQSTFSHRKRKPHQSQSKPWDDT